MEEWLKMDYRLITTCSLMGRINGFENLDLKVRALLLNRLKILDDCVRKSHARYLERWSTSCASMSSTRRVWPY
jgi:hypothetical protein